MDGFTDPLLRSKKLELEYPCRWQFKLIGEDEFQLRKLVDEVLGERDYKLSLSNTSSTGRYRSLLLALEVASEHERHKLGERFQRSEHVRMVL